MEIITRTIFVITFAQALRYLFFAGVSYKLINKFKPYNITKSDLKRELKYSLLTILMHGTLFGLFFSPVIRPYTLVYTDPTQYGKVWLILSFPILVLIHDTYFYWMHRTLHHPKLYRKFHLVHHESNPPTPFASQSFHPYETFFELIWVVPVIFIIPLYLPNIIIFSFFSLIYNIYGHSNIDFYPKSWNDHKIFKWLNTSSAHQEHHRKFEGNYGLYFSFWDRWQKTLRNSTTIS